MAFLGMDVGTSAVKTLLIDEGGRILASATVEYPLFTPRPLWSEQNADDWWTATVQAIRAALAKAGLTGDDVRSIGLSGQMHGLTLLDKSGAVLRPAILWNDQRTARQVQEMIDAVGGQAGVQRWMTNRPNPSYTAPKMLWVREHEPKVYAKAKMALVPKDFIRYKLSGEFASEVTDATGMALLDIKKRDWSQKLLDVLDIPRSMLPSVSESHVVTASVSTSAAMLTGLRAGTPIVGGGGDVSAAGLGAGAVREGIVMTVLGTSGVMFACTNEFKSVKGGLETFCHAVPDKWHFMGVMLSAGGSLRWLRDTLAKGDPGLVQPTPGLARDPYDVMLDGAAKVAPGSDGLVFLPYLSGERTPHQNPLARGAFVGLTLAHTQAHLTRAVVEGVAFGLKDGLELMRGAGLTVKEVRVTGGAAKSAFWRQTLADVFDTDITVLNITEGSAYGVALLAGVASKHWKDIIQACDATLKPESRTKPNRKTRAAYADAYARFKQLYPALAPTFAATAGK